MVPDDPEQTMKHSSGSKTGDRQAGPEYRRLFDGAIEDTFRQALRIVSQYPAILPEAVKIAWYQKKAAGIRRKFERKGLLVPPVVIISVTSRCNLACAGCYMKQRNGNAPEMRPDLFSSVIEEAAGLGVGIIVIAGGEPLMRKDEILSVAWTHPRILFPLFTNGLMIDDNSAKEIGCLKNIVPMISFEGSRNDTDDRRGKGVYDRLLKSCSALQQNGIFFGCSVTVTSRNLPGVTDEEFIRGMVRGGARVFVFVEYVPIEPGTEDLVLTRDQQVTLHTRISLLENQFPALFIGFPGDETRYGGCLAAGRGFIHVSSSGGVEPCPAAPFSDANLADISLRDALQSPFFAKIRLNHTKLTETNGGCALWTNRAWAKDLLTPAYAPERAATNKPPDP